MIETIADLLNAIVAKEKEAIAQVPDLNHPGMLGDMYEGVAKHILECSLLRGLDLRVVEGKARDSRGNLSGQLDCMVVEGEGFRLPKTDHFIYDMHRIIAVVEVKKTLYGDDLKDSFIHLRDVSNPEIAVDNRFDELIHDAWRGVMRREVPLVGEEELEEDEMVFKTLSHEAQNPLKIVLGYEGYQSEFTLREGLIRFLTEATTGLLATQPIRGFGPSSFPNLIICGKSCIFKADGMPFAPPSLKSGFWQFLVSMPDNALRTLLELLWTRLAYIYKLPPVIFGEDLEIETVNRLVDAKWRTGQPGGWELLCTEMSQRQLEDRPPKAQWHPQKLTAPEFVVIQRLCAGKEVKIDDAALVSYLGNNGLTAIDFAHSLNEKHLAFLKGNQLFLLTEQIIYGFFDGECVAGDNKTGRMERWILKNLRSKSPK